MRKNIFAFLGAALILLAIVNAGGGGATKGYLYTSIDGGLFWTRQTSPGYRIWSKIASSTDGTKLAAVAGSSYIYTSNDSGATWTAQINSGVRGWTAIASSADGSKLVACVNGEYIYTSNDSGVTWTPRTDAGLGAWQFLVFSPDGMRIIADCVNGHATVSTDGGATWTTQAYPSGGNWATLVFSADGTKLAGVSGSQMYTSSDSGATWILMTNAEPTIYWRTIACSADGTKLAAAGDNSHIYTSSDSGATWTVQSNSIQTNWQKIACSADGKKLVAIGNNNIYTSTDSGVTWTLQTNAGQRGWGGIVSSGDGNKYLAYTYTSDTGAAPVPPTDQAGPVVFSESAGVAVLTHQTPSANPISVMRMMESALGLGVITQTMLNDVVMTSNATGARIDVPSTNPVAATVNASGGVASVHMVFYNAPNARIYINNKQATTLGGSIFPAYTGYLRNVSFNAAAKILEFDITHFTQYGIKYLTSEPFTGTAGDATIQSFGVDTVASYPGGSAAGAVTQDVNIPVLSIHGLAYETLSADLGVSGNLYTPVVPGQPYGFSFEYINRGNMTDTYGVLPTIETTGGHFVADVAAPSIVVAPWQVAYADVNVSANNTTVSYERATLNVSIYIDNPVWDNAEDLVASYNAFNGAYVGGTYADEGIYGGLGDSAMNYTFVLSAEGYTVKVLSRTVTVNAPNGTAQLLPGAKIKYDIAVQNLGGSIATSVNIKDLIPANCHLYHTDAPTVVGTTEWAWLGATDNAATQATVDAVKYEITIPALTTVTASYTVTLD
jgi:uncharacterized repeat protein (TIGR01451 family)